MSTTSTPGFTGVSSYASDLQQVISRAVSIASLPLTQMQNQMGFLQAQQASWNGLDSDFASMQSAITAVDQAMGQNSYGSASSASAYVTSSVTTGALEGSYTVDVSSVGSFSSSISDPSLPAVADPNTTSISLATDYTLTVNGKTTDIAPSGTSLSSLAQAINSASAGVQASIVNTGDSGSPQYRLILRSTNLAADSIQLTAQNAGGPQDLLDTMSTGAPATYSIDGLGGTISSNTRTVALAPGLSINLVAPTPTGQPVTITVSRNTSAASTALSNFVDAYNTTVDALNAQVGQTAGALSGESELFTLRDSLRQITQYTGTSGGVTLLAQLGVNLDSTGKLTFDASTFSAASTDDVQNFLGSADVGGFLKAASDALNSVEDPTAGSLKNTISSVNNQVLKENNLIVDQQQKVTTLQNNLTQQMANADSAIAALESQRDYLSNLFTAMMNNNSTSSSGVKSSF